MKTSAGILFYQRQPDRVILVHASGNYNAKAPWSIPKGEPGKKETIEQAAMRECQEEIDVLAIESLQPLGTIQYAKSGKIVHGFACPLPPKAFPRCKSWEIDRVELLTIDQARRIIHPRQAPFLDRLEALWKV